MTNVAAASLERLNSLPGEAAEQELRKCCGSTNWIRRMVEQRPFQNAGQLFDVADRVWRELSSENWLEAFRHHPRIGEKNAAAGNLPDAQRWSRAEQAGASNAVPEMPAVLAEANRAYEARFGYIFIVCATGKSFQEILEILRQRLQNDPGQEIRVAAEEQRKITRLRLEKLLSDR
jgi:OHCU decarboxylase